MGGMAGCAMIGQSIINIKSGGRGRLSTFVAGTLLILMVVFMDEWIRQNPHGSTGGRDDHGFYRNVFLGFTA